MAEPFDPYWKWLGIPPKQQPPNAYRLLGIELFESDADVISNAADQRMAHVRNFAAGEHSALAKKILNEIAKSRVRLLNAETKADYDRKLRTRLGNTPLDKPKRPAVRQVAQAKPWSPAPMAADLPVATRPPVPNLVPIIDTSEAATLGRRKRRLRRALIGGGLMAAIIGVGLVLIFGGDPLRNGGIAKTDDNERPTETTDKDNGPVEPTADKSDRSNPPSNEGSQDDETTADEGSPSVEPPTKTPPVAQSPRTEPKATLTVLLPEGDRRDATLAIDDRKVPIPTTGNAVYSLPAGSHILTIARTGYETDRVPFTLKPGEAFRFKWSFDENNLVRMDERPRVDERPGVTQTPSVAEPTNPTTVVKVAPPDTTTKRTVAREVRELYSDDFELATHSRAKVGLARQLRRDGEETKNDPTGRFVLFETALDLATEGADLDEAMTIIDRIDALYTIDTIGMRTKTIEAVAKRVSVGPEATEEKNEQILQLAEDLQAEAMAEADVPSAIRFVQVAISAARRLQDTPRHTKLRNSLEELNELRSRGDLVQKAVAALERTPEHPKANEVAGCWYCFVVGDWEKGLPWLAKAEDAELAELAKQDLAEPQEATKQATMGDRWYDLGETKEDLLDLEDAHLKTRAGYWYKRAMPKLTGLPARRLEKRLAEMGVSMGNYALQFDGKKSRVVVPNFGIGMNVPITVEALVKSAPRTMSSANQAILSNINFPGEAGLSLGQFSSSDWVFRFYAFRTSSSGSVYETLEQAYSHPGYSARHSGNSGRSTSDHWTHVAGVFDGREIRLYVDGQLKGSHAVSGMHNPSRLPLMIGASPSRSGVAQITPNEFFQGQIKAVRISQKVLYTTAFDPPDELRHQGRSTALQFSFDAGLGNRIKSGKYVATIYDAEWVEPEAPLSVPTPPKPTRPTIPGVRLGLPPSTRSR